MGGLPPHWGLRRRPQTAAGKCARALPWTELLLQCRVCSVQSAMCNVQCTMYNVLAECGKEGEAARGGRHQFTLIPNILVHLDHDDFDHDNFEYDDFDHADENVKFTFTPNLSMQ